MDFYWKDHDKRKSLQEINGFIAVTCLWRHKHEPELKNELTIDISLRHSKTRHHTNSP